MNPPHPNKIRKIIHVDMDAFYASVEIKDNPELAKRPLIVGGSPESRSVVCAASYEARKFGIRSAMPCATAKRLCPQAVFVLPRFKRYQEISRQIHQIFARYSEIIEPLSLDEAWLDVTQNLIDCPSATMIAQKIKREIKEETGLTASAGVSYNKFLAKIASDEKKPDGLFVITPQNAADFLDGIEVGKLPGVGRVTKKRLEEMKIVQGYQLRNQSQKYLTQRLGKFGSYLYDLIRGIDLSPVKTTYDRKSIGIENTFAFDYAFGESLVMEMGRLVKGLEKRLIQQEKRGKTLTLKVKFADFSQVTRSVSDPAFLSDSSMFQRVLLEKLKEVCQIQHPGKKVRLLGASISNFGKVEENKSSNLQLDMYHFLSNPGEQAIVTNTDSTNQ